MFLRHFWKAAFFSLGFIALIVGVPGRAQVPQPPGTGLVSRSAGNSRYDAWVQEIPVAAPTQDYGVDVPFAAQSASPDQVEDAAGFTGLTFASLRDDNWEIYSSNLVTGDLLHSDRITNDPADDVLPSGRPGTYQIVFASNRTGNFELFQAEFGGANLKQLTFNEAYDSQPAWSPDGKRLAFVSNRDGNQEIYVMQADGSGVIRLTYSTGDDFGPAWSPDGSQLVWVVALTDQEGALCVMNADGSNQHLVSIPLRYLQHPSWSPDGGQFFFDYDANLDGWSDLALMNADGSNLHVFLSGQNLSDFWAGSWTTVPDYPLVYSHINYVLYDNDYYIREARICMRSEGGSNSDCFWGSGFDFYPDTAPYDITVPETYITPLPDYQRPGDFPVTVVGTDPGPALIDVIYLQYRSGLLGEWTDWANTLYTKNRSFTFSGQPGSTVYFRSQGIDHADHLEPWPPGDGDTFTQIYSWQLSGTVSDNRGTKIPDAGVVSAPVFSDQQDASRYGVFHRYVPTATVSLDVDKPGFGALPTVQISSTVDLPYEVVLPPADNLLANGGFEAGLDSWTFSGACGAQVDPSFGHSGSSSMELGWGGLNPETSIVTSENGYSTSPSSTKDQDGNTHLLWEDSPVDTEAFIYYAWKGPDGIWSTPIKLNPDTSMFSRIPDLTIGADGTLHAVWLEWSFFDAVIYYASRSPQGDWSQAVNISGTRTWYAPVDNIRPLIAVDAANNLHVVWADSSGLMYVNKPDGGNWSAPLNVSASFEQHALATGPDNSLVVVFNHGQPENLNLAAISRSKDGTWSSPINLWANMASDMRMVSDPQGVGYLIWRDMNNVYFSKRPTSGVWTTPQVISNENEVYQINLAVGGTDVHAAWYGDQGMKYRRLYGGQRWSPVSDLSAPEIWLGFDLSARQGDVDIFWSQDSFPNTVLQNTSWTRPRFENCRLTQTVSIPESMHEPTLSFLQHLEQDGSGGTLQVAIDDSPVYTGTQASPGWEHAWLDLSPWLSQTVTVTFRFENDLALGEMDVHLDDISLGSWMSPVISDFNPKKIDAWTNLSIFVDGENFIQGAYSWFNGNYHPVDQWVDARHLVIDLPSGLAPGMYDLQISNPGGQQSLPLGKLAVGKQVMLPVIRR